MWQNVLILEDALPNAQVGLGDGMRGDHLTWRHTCATLDFVNGDTKLFENGKMYFEKTDVEDIRETYKANKKEIDIVTVGWDDLYSCDDKEKKHKKWSL